MKIDKDIPIPPRTSHRKKYPVEELKVGDSILIERLDNEPDGRISARVANIARFYRDKLEGTAYTWRYEDDNMRLWRIK